MTLNKKILAAAIVGGLFATAAQAQVVLSVPAASSSNPTLYASEIRATTAAPIALAAITANEIRTALGFSFSADAVFHARIECSPNFAIVGTNIAGLTVSTADVTAVGGAANVGAINGAGTNIISFSITAPAGGLAATNAIRIQGTRSITSATNATCAYSLYDTPSQAFNGGALGLITSTSQREVANFTSSIALRAIATSRIASVEASPSFSAFVLPVSGTAHIGQVFFGLRSEAALAPNNVQPRLADGTVPLVAPALPADPRLSTFITTGSNHVVTGDFSLAASTGATPFNAAANARVYFNATDDCVKGGVGTFVNASSLTATTATFLLETAVPGFFLCLTRSAPNLIAASPYSIQFNPVATSPTVYSVAPIGPIALGSITRNGTELQAPLVQLPAGWLSRVALTNTSGVARTYSFSAQTEAGTTAVLGSAATGTIPANGTIVLPVSDIVTFTGQPRGTLNVSIAAGTTAIQGLYQIVNPASGSISNHVMVRPGLN